MNDTSLDLSAIATRFHLRAQAFAVLLASLDDVDWESASRCADWTAAEVVDHVIDTERDFVGRFDSAIEVPEAETRLARFEGVRSVIQDLLDDPTTAATGYDGMLGPTTFAASIDGFYGLDLVIHRWDVAAACAKDEAVRIDPSEIVNAYRTLEVVPAEMMRLPGLFGPEVAVPDDADEQAKLLAWLGRDPRS